MGFTVCQEIITPESAEHGDADNRQILGEKLSLRDAVDLVLETRTNHMGGREAVEADSWPATDIRWLTVYNQGEFLTDATENRSLHFPPGLTAATRRRILDLVKRSA